MAGILRVVDRQPALSRLVWLTYSWMIEAPRRYLLYSQIDRLDLIIRVAMKVRATRNEAIVNTLQEKLAGLSATLNDRGHNFVRRPFRTVQLNKLMAPQQTLNGLTRLTWYLVPDDGPTFRRDDLLAARRVGQSG